MFDQLFKLLVVNHAKAAEIPGATLIEPGGEDSLKQVAVNIINYAFIIGGGLAVIYIIYAGIAYMTAGSDQAKVDQAKNGITYAVIGIVIIALAYVILNWVNNSIAFMSEPSTGVTPNL